MTNTPRDHNELEPLTEETWEQVLNELRADNPSAGDAIADWLEDHRGHEGTYVRWWVPDGYSIWFAHGRCNGCRVDSRQHMIGSD